MIRPILTLLFLLIAAGVPSAAQEFADSARALVGKEMLVPLRMIDPDNGHPGPATMEGSLLITNPTIFYPERFVALPGDTILASTLTRLTDSTYRFSLTVSSPRGSIRSGDSLAFLAGEALAGSDSTGLIYFFHRDESSPRALVVLRTTSIGNRLHYVRPPSLTPAFPNPSKRGTMVRFGYLVDRPSEVTFKIYAITGEEIVSIDAGRITQDDVSRGQTLDFEITFDISSGIYLVRMVTNSGDAYTKMTVIR
jgi:hypothetical protein